jgi:hypothetical protein
MKLYQKYLLVGVALVAMGASYVNPYTLLRTANTWTGYQTFSGGASGVTASTNIDYGSYNNVLATNAQFASATIGTASFTNGVKFPVSTTWTALNEGSNYAIDMSLPSMNFAMTTNLNLVHCTNGVANFAVGVTYTKNIKINNGSGTNFPVSFNANWHRYGSYTSNYFILTNGDWCTLAVRFMGPSTDQTNVDVGVAYKNP